MWNKLVYDRGGLPLHAGCKIIPTERGERVGLIVGLSGTGKTTTTFTRQNGSIPVQDDFVAWIADGRVYVTENGCFAKTFGINPEDEPRSTAPSRSRDSYLENVSQPATTSTSTTRSYTQNGRATFPFERDRVGGDAPDRRGALPAHPEPQREHHPRGREARRAAGSGLLHARRDAGHERRRRGRRRASSCACRARTRSSRCRTTSRGTASSSCSRSTRSRCTS